MQTFHNRTFSSFVQIYGARQRCWGIGKAAVKKRGQSPSRKGSRRSRAGAGNTRMAERRVLCSRSWAGVSPGLPGRADPSKTAASEAIAEAAVSLWPRWRRLPGHRCCALQMLRPSSSAVLPAAFPGAGKELLRGCFAIAPAACATPKANPSVGAQYMTKHPFLKSRVGFVVSLLSLLRFRSMCWTTLSLWTETCQFSKEDN